MEKVSVYTSIFEDGRKFEGDVSVDLYRTNESARERLYADREHVKEMFSRYYDEDDIIEEDDDYHISIFTNDYDDYWEGRVEEKEIN